MPHEPGDKVRIRSTGARAVVCRQTGSKLEVRLGDVLAVVDPEEVTNYSLAARRAWVTRPKKAGRPPLPTVRKKLISLRVDIEILDWLAVLSEWGSIPSREAAINRILRERIPDMIKEEQARVVSGKSRPGPDHA